MEAEVPERGIRPLPLSERRRRGDDHIAVTDQTVSARGNRDTGAWRLALDRALEIDQALIGTCTTSQT